MSAIFELRKKYKEEFKAKARRRTRIYEFFYLKLVVHALKEFPDVHSMIDGDHQIKFDFDDVSIAVSGPKGLMVPVVRDCQDLLTFSRHRI